MPTKMDIATAITKLGSRDKSDYQPAEAALRQRGIDALEQLLERWVSDRSRYVARLRIIVPSFVLAFILYLPAISAIPENNWPALLLVMCIEFGAIFAVALLCEPPRSLSRIRALVGEIEDLRALGPLISRVGGNFKGAVGDAQRRQDAVARLFLKVRASDATLITDQELAHMHYVLKHWEHFDIGPTYGTEYLCAIHKALVQVGGSPSIPYVRRVVETAPHSAKPRVTPLSILRRGYNGTWIFLSSLGTGGRFRPVDRIQLAAEANECLEALLAKTSQERDSEVLLRPALDCSQDTLLHPAVSHCEPSGQLLRAMDTTPLE